MILTGMTGGVIGSFMGGTLPIVGMALVGALIGNIVWILGGQHVFFFILIGIVIGGGLAIFVSGMEAALLGVGTGGAIGGFVGVNVHMLRPRE